MEKKYHHRICLKPFRLILNFVFLLILFFCFKISAYSEVRKPPLTVNNCSGVWTNTECKKLLEKSKKEAEDSASEYKRQYQAEENNLTPKELKDIPLSFLNVKLSDAELGDFERFLLLSAQAECKKEDFTYEKCKKLILDAEKEIEKRQLSATKDEIGRLKVKIKEQELLNKKIKLK